MAVDPFWDNVVLRMTFDGTLEDVSNSGHVLTPESYTGTGAAFFATDGKFNDCYHFSTTNNATVRLVEDGLNPDWDLGDEDFTLEFWWGANTYHPNGTSYFAVFDPVNGQRSFRFGVASYSAGTGAGRIYGQMWDGTSATPFVEVSMLYGASYFDLRNRWTHFCFERAGGVLRLYVDGVMRAKSAFSASKVVRPQSLSGHALTINGVRSSAGGTYLGAGQAWDDLRFTKGVARYNSDAGFALPTEAYPTSSGSEPVEVNPAGGGLALEGQVPTVIGQQVVTPSAGALEITGSAPTVATSGEAYPLPGSLVITGQAPEIFDGIMARPTPGQLLINPGAPEVLIFTESSAIVTQQAVLEVAVPPPPPARVDQLAAMAIGYVVPDVAVSQQAILVVAHGGPCVTSRCQIWTITRRDGRVFRYTSHDEDVQFGLETYKACHSLNPSASENASSLGSVGNIELVGIIDDDGISEADLYGGRFDDAYVTVDLIAWGSPVEAPRRLASGWTGQLSQGDTSFNMEVLGSSSRLEQQALTQPYAPGCRWIFGDSRCGVDVEAKKLSGQITSVASRARFGAELSGGPGAWQWANGRVRFLTGPNAGQVLEVKTVDFATGLITLWPSAAMLPTAGDEFELLPGCDLAKEGGCSVYANVINFGGFPDVPGEDAMLETPNAQY